MAKVSKASTTPYRIAISFMEDAIRKSGKSLLELALDLSVLPNGDYLVNSFLLSTEEFDALVNPEKEHSKFWKSPKGLALALKMSDLAKKYR